MNQLISIPRHAQHRQSGADYKFLPGRGNISSCARRAQFFFLPPCKIFAPSVWGQSYNRGGANICYLHSSWFGYLCCFGIAFFRKQSVPINIQELSDGIYLFLPLGPTYVISIQYGKVSCQYSQGKVDQFSIVAGY